MYKSVYESRFFFFNRLTKPELQYDFIIFILFYFSIIFWIIIIYILDIVSKHK